MSSKTAMHDFERGADRLVFDGHDPRLTDTFIHDREELWRSIGEIVVTGVDSAVPHAAALSIAAACSGEFIIAELPMSGRRYATIAPASRPQPPKPLAHPPRPANVPATMEIGLPDMVANDYGSAVRHARRGPMPTVPISVVIPVYNRRIMLSRTLASLLHQTYPLDLIEIVVADDGSSDRPDEVLDSFAGHFQGVRYPRQDDEGYRLAAVRNLGVQRASHDNLIILDCDMAPTPRLVELFARHIETFPDALYLGHRRYVDANDVPIDAVRASIEPMLSLHDIETANLHVGRGGASRTTDWRLPSYASTNDLRFERYPFRVVCGGNIGFTRDLFEISGGFDEDFTDWGAEDAEWGYRVWNRGFYIVPIIDACGLHQEPPGGRNETDREVGSSRTRPMLTGRCPVHFRARDNDGGFSVPRVSIYIPAFNAQDTIVGAVQSALQQSVPDLEVCVVDDGSTDETLSRLIEHFADDPRVRVQTQENRGIGAASNRAVSMCRGTFIGQLDADDELRRNAVEVLLDPLMRDTRIGVAYGSHVHIDPDGDLIGNAWVNAKYSHFVMLHSMIAHHFRLFRARDWYRTTGFAEDITNAVDYDMFLKLAEVTEMVHVERRIYRYRVHPSSTSQRQREQQYRNHAVVVGRALERRGIAADWRMEPIDPDDARKYRFIERRTPAERLAVPSSRIRVRGSDKKVARNTTSAFPTWKFDVERDKRRVTLTSPRMSSARVASCAETLRDALADTDAELEILT